MDKMTVMNELKNRGFEVEEKTFEKNGVLKSGIIFGHEGDTVKPTIYDDAFENVVEEDFDGFIDNLIKIYDDRTSKFNMDDISNPQFVKSNVIVGLQRTSNRDILKKPFVDGIEKYLRVLINDEASFIIQKSMLSTVALTEDELWQTAELNTENDISVKSMAETLAEIMGMDVSEFEDSMGDPGMEMYVMTNKLKTYGASTMLNKAELKKLADKMNTDKLIILPSSIHEVIVVNGNNNDDTFTSMVQEVNATQVTPEEQLGDRAIAYDVVTEKYTTI